eukprot:jgi/Tetstr1/432902/TSEL_002344.t1
MWGAHSVDRFASALNAMLPRYNDAWLDPGCEAVDSLHLSDAEWRRENNFCNPPWPLLPDLGVPPLGGTAATVARYIAWQGLRGTVKAASLQPYLSAINGFYRDHGAEPVAQGDLISKVRKGLAASQVEPDPPGVRTDVPARLITRRTDMAAGGDPGLLRSARTASSRWAVTHDEPAASWTSATVTDWLQLVAHMSEEHPPPGFVWTSHSLRKGAATAAYAIGVVLQKNKHFGGWAQSSSVVLDNINPTALPCAASWQLFGWLTPWGGPPATGCPPMGGMMANAALLATNASYQYLYSRYAYRLDFPMSSGASDSIRQPCYMTHPRAPRGESTFCLCAS